MQTGYWKFTGKPCFVTIIKKQQLKMEVELITQQPVCGTLVVIKNI